MKGRLSIQITIPHKMKQSIIIAMILLGFDAYSQTNPAIVNFLINTTDLTGRHYLEGNSTPIVDEFPANVQSVQYSSDYSYMSCSGIPSYIIGPYPDGNPALASDNEHLFKLPLIPAENTGNLTSTPLGPIGVFINGVPMYDYKDGNSYNNQGVWNRDAILAEKDGFDCAKGHPSPVFDGPPGPGSTLIGGTYHHHQNPSAFNLDLVVISDICDLYLADGLYVIDAEVHSPLLGYAFDGYPVYGAYGYTNPDEAGEISRIRSSYKLRDITARTTYADGSDVTDGPAVSTTYPLGFYREDYEFDALSGDLDEHNGRFCVTPEYPDGIYCYFATVDENWNSAYPYLVGPTYYGVVETDNFSGPGQGGVTITEPVVTYNPANSVFESMLDESNITVFPNPTSDLIAIQLSEASHQNIQVELFDVTGKLVNRSQINQGSTIAYFDTKTLYAGEYLLVFNHEGQKLTRRIIVTK